MTQPLLHRPTGPAATPLGRTLVNGVALLGANLTTAAAQYAIVVLVARALGPATFGAYLFAYTYAAFFATICNFGLDRIVIREVVRRPPGASTYLFAAAAVRVVFGLLSVASALSIAWWFGYPPDVRLAMTLLLVSQVLALFSELFRSVLYGSGAMPYEARLRATGRFLAVGLVASVLVMRWGLLGVAGALAVAAFLELLLYAVGARRRLALRRVPTEWVVATDLVHKAWPIALNTVLVVVYFRINILMLTAWKGAEAAGFFGAAFTFVQVLQVVSGSLAGVLLPTLTARRLEGPERVRAAVETTTYYVLLLVLPTSVVLSLMARDLVGLVYGAKYLATVQPLAVLAWANVFMFLGSLYGTLLIVLDAQRSLMWVSVMALGVSLVANMLLIPSLGELGASWATVTTEASVAAATFLLALRKLPGITPGRAVLKPLVVAAAAAFVLWVMHGQGVALKGAVVGAVSVVSAVLLRAIPIGGWSAAVKQARGSRTLSSL